MSDFVQSLLSSAFPNVKPPAPKGKKRPATTPVPAVVDSLHNAVAVAQDAVTPVALDSHESLIDDNTLPLESWDLNATGAAIILATVWLFATWFLVRRRQRRARAALAAQQAAATKLKADALRQTVQELVEEQTGVIESQIQASVDARLKAIQNNDAPAVNVVRQEALDGQISNLEETFRETLSQHIKSLEESYERNTKERIQSLEEVFEKTMTDRVMELEESFDKTMNERIEAIDETMRRRVNQRLEALESRIKLDSEAIEDFHRSINQRMENLEEGVRILDGKQLDQEASHITQRSLSVRIESIESTLQALDNKTRASSQRLEAVDDSSRVIDSRTKALSQRMEAVEDNLSATEGQVTLLSHDAGRGVDAIEKMQKHVKSLPGNERLRQLTVAWEERFNELESRFEQNQLALEEAHMEPEPMLTWSHIESVDIEPTGPIYTRPSYGQAHSYSHSPTLSFDGSLPPTPSSSGRSYSFSSSNGPVVTPTNMKRRRIEAAGFTDTTFSSRQKLFAAAQQQQHRHSRSLSRQHSII